LGSVRGWPTSNSSSVSSFDSDYSNSPSPSPTAKNIYANGIFSQTSHQFKSAIDTDASIREFSPASKGPSNISHNGARDIPTVQRLVSKDVGNGGLDTPPLTPDTSPLSALSKSMSAPTQGVEDKAAHDFLLRLFPGSTRIAIPYAKSVRITSSELSIASEDLDSFAFEGVVLDLPNRPRTLYIDGKDAENVKLRESIVALLDLADDHLECTALVIALERSSPALAGLLHSFMYAGASVVTRPPFEPDQAYVLVGIEI